MPKAARIGDIGSGHGCFPPTPVIAGSGNVMTNGIPAARVGDAVAPHGCGNCPPHGRSISAGSGSVFINGKPAARVGDSITCGGSVSAGSGDVIIGDQFTPSSSPNFFDAISPTVQKEITELYFSYGTKQKRLSSESRHYPDINLHAKTIGYSNGESVSIKLEGAVSKTVSGVVGAGGQIIISNVLDNQYVDLEGEL
ncbi:type VI secretion system PAAR protein [Neptuniibacter sp. UBA6509]|uniref:type VI secretion system PAAR protein n=1 Tax=Neptuniibacter sp. UBA6509 TaxID=1946976 RepID=UPI0025CE9A6B|nr:type VI secretion system PAAR protein [Neptuniibacter sp. UBA6509]|tara:strand:+ start:2130 stop:2720 length:591 start_codon:yes stop_codon:yes gene_type:complete